MRQHLLENMMMPGSRHLSSLYRLTFQLHGKP